MLVVAAMRVRTPTYSPDPLMLQMTLLMIMVFMFGAALQIADLTSNKHDDVQEIHLFRVELATDLSPYHDGRSPSHEEAQVDPC